MYRYEVVATESVVKEMARYDEATFTRLKFVSFGFFNPTTDEKQALEKCACLFGEEMINSMLQYRWRLTSEHPPTTARWASFGIRVITLP